MAEQEELLILLEKDIARMYFCHYCVKLHRWSKRWNNSLPARNGDVDLACRNHFWDHRICLPNSGGIDYHHARLAMNRHLYGPSHGLRVRNLEHTYSLRFTTIQHNCLPWTIGWLEVADSGSLHARIQDNKLLVLSTQTLSHPRGNSKKLRREIDDSCRGVCKHITLGASSILAIQLPELVDGRTGPDRFTPCTQSVKSCPICLTDYCISMTWRGRMKGYIIKVHAYRQLGDCRSPFDSVWRSFTRSFTQLSYVRPKEIRITHPTKYRPVFIRDKWNHPDGLESSTRAEWVEIPGLEATRKRIESVSQPDKQHTSSVG